MALENRAAQIPGPKRALEVTSLPANHPAPGEILIRNHAIAVQPLDAKMLLSGYGGAGALQNYPALLGTSGAGVIEELGEGVNGLNVGDRVVFDTKAYVKPDVNQREGTWQRLVICDARTVAKIGDVAFEQAILVDFPLQTAVGALHLFLGMGKPGTGSVDEKVLVWGAGGAVGHTVIVTASPRDKERQKALGASEVLDYKSSDVAEQLRALGPYKYLFTGSGDAASQKVLASLLQPEGGQFASVLGGEVELPSNVERVYKAFSQAAQQDEQNEFRAWWYSDYLPRVLQENLVESAKFTKREGGLAALQQASADVFEGKVRGKIVVNPQE
ncbi:oxidoreductase domain-containing protein [Melanomma pulvis-pyrius CBS 109.77]|uniref:Oxidoreductase domain-containing protein n=1 Tax=Melanomma pulvis-pyrius CBS 109.77 TaxID=1314802 RepID=A0A6A6X9P8_9PLEO|nr:oxidoreductase domain-containing protein [Melanomma pulvis-pyrius CBS 109.77]